MNYINLQYLQKANIIKRKIFIYLEKLSDYI